jgi:methyl coenzyme M reductase beta subunit
MDKLSKVAADVTGVTENDDTGLKDVAIEAETLSQKVNRRLRLRADLIVLPLITMSSVMALLDKVGYDNHKRRKKGFHH